ncbi:MAG TPA: hypothetical protein DCQ04_10470 [Actinobacteria bacterium]|nr:hypothetical protein [Actinomycetota bacterium]
MPTTPDWSDAGGWLHSIAEPIKDALLSKELGAVVGSAVGGEVGARVGATVLGGIGDQTRKQQDTKLEPEVNQRLAAGSALVIPVLGLAQSVVIVGPAEVTYIPVTSEYRQLSVGDYVLREGGRSFDLLSGEARREKFSGKQG